MHAYPGCVRHDDLDDETVMGLLANIQEIEAREQFNQIVSIGTALGGGSPESKEYMDTLIRTVFQEQEDIEKAHMMIDIGDAKRGIAVQPLKTYTDGHKQDGQNQG